VDPFAKRIYSDWLEINLLTQNLQFPGFENVINNRMDFAAITAIRFISQPIPHIDPTKETTAIIDKVDNNLMTRQQATEELGTGDWEDVIEKIKQENELLPEQPIAQQPDNQDDE
jgi:capsid protein